MLLNGCVPDLWNKQVLGTTVGSVQGCFNIGLPSNKSLFQLHADRVLRLQQLAEHFIRAAPGSCKIFFYILTSDATHARTIEFFSENAFFGLQRSQLFFFQQASMPCLNTMWETIIQEDGTVCARMPSCRVHMLAGTAPDARSLCFNVPWYYLC